MSKYAMYDEQIEKLHSEGLRNVRIAEKTGIDSRRVSDRMKILGLEPNERTFNDQPTEEEELIFRSMFFGDGAIFKSKGNKNYRVNLAHSPKQKEYFLMKYNKVKNFIGVDYFKETQFHNIRKKHYHCYKFQSKVNPYFTRMRKKWYRDGKKIIPKDIGEFLTAELLAYKFFDDGSIIRVGYSIATSGYDEESLNYFIKAVDDNFGIKMNKHKSKGGHDLYIPSKYASKFKQLVLPYATSDVLYKLGEFRETLNK